MDLDAILYLLRKMLALEVIFGLLSFLCALLLARHFWFTRVRDQINRYRDSNEALERQCRRLDRRSRSLRQNLYETRAHHVGKLRNILEDGSISGLRADAEISHMTAQFEAQSDHLESAQSTLQALHDRVAGARLQLTGAATDLGERIKEAPTDDQGDLAERLRKAADQLPLTETHLESLEGEISAASNDIKQAKERLSATLRSIRNAGGGLSTTAEQCGDATSWLATGYASGTTELKNDDLRQRLAGCETSMFGIVNDIEEAESSSQAIDGAIDAWEIRCEGLREKLELSGRELLEQAAQIHACSREFELHGILLDNDHLAATGNGVAGSGERLLMGEQQLAELGGKLLNSRKSIFELGRNLRTLRASFGQQSQGWLVELQEVTDIEPKIPAEKWEIHNGDRELPENIASREKRGIYRLGPAPGTGVELARLRGELSAAHSVPASQALPHEMAVERETATLRDQLTATKAELLGAREAGAGEGRQLEALEVENENFRQQIEVLEDSIDARDGYLKKLKQQLANLEEAADVMLHKQVAPELPAPPQPAQSLPDIQIMPAPFVGRPADVDETLGALAASEALGSDDSFGGFFPDGSEAGDAFLDEMPISSPDLRREIDALRQEERGAVADLAEELGLQDTSMTSGDLKKTDKPTDNLQASTSRHPLFGLIYEKPIHSADDLCKLPNVGSATAQKLNAGGVYTFQQIANWDGVAWWAWAARLGLPKTDRHAEWVLSARKLIEKTEI